MIDQAFKKLFRARAYRRLFLTETGQLRKEALAVLDDLYEFTRIFHGQVPLDALPFTEGGRSVVRHILNRLKMTDQELKRQIHKGVTPDE